MLREAQCGYCVAPDDAQALASAVKNFMGAGKKATLGQNARRYYEAHFLRAEFMDKLENELKSMSEK